MRIEQQSDWIIIHCEHCIDNTTVTEQRELLVEALNYKKNIQIDAEQLSKISAAGLQLLLNFSSTIRQQNLTWQWRKVSDALLKAAASIGISHLLALQQSETMRNANRL